MIRKYPLALGPALLLCVICTQTPAQPWLKKPVEPAAKPMVERVIAITESVGYEIDPAERQQYGLFDGYGGFLAAEVVATAERYSLWISYRRDKDRLVERIPLAADELQALRQRITAVDAQIRTGARREAATSAEQEGRLRLVTDGFLYGAYLYGFGTTELLGLEGRAATGVGLLITGGTFAGTLNATKDYRLGYGRTKLVRWGNFAGTFYGLAIPGLLGTDNNKVYFASAMTLTPVGGYTLYRLTSDRRTSKGEADLITTGMLVGALYGLAMPYVIGIGDIDNQPKAYLASSMAGMPIGGLVTSRFVRDRPISRGRAHLISLGGLLGAAYAVTVIDLTDDEVQARPYALTAMVGLPVGAYMGYRLTESEDYTLGRGRMITVGAYAGSLVGQGLIYSVGADSQKVLNVAGMLGSALGVWFTHGATKGWGEHLTGREDSSTEGVTVTLLTPEALFSIGMLARSGTSGGRAIPVELLRIEF
jgi:hypothetical protein